jgi:hypothetical protein
MKKYSDAIKKIRITLKALAAEKPKLREEIRQLKFGPNGERRPETGPERCNKKTAYNLNVRPNIRTHLLAYGLLRDVPYVKMEPTTGPLPYWFVSNILHDIHEAIGDNAELKAEWTEERIVKLLERPAPAASEAAE